MRIKVEKRNDPRTYFSTMGKQINSPFKTLRTSLEGVSIVLIAEH